MLVPAILYKEQIQKGFQKYYYTTDMMYETGCLEQWCPDISEAPSTGRFDYAIVHNGKLIGYLAYQVDYYASKAYNFGLLSFDRGNALIGRDVYKKINELVNRFNRVEWRAISGNPACRSYDSFIEKYNGNKHVLKDAIRDRAGNYHDGIIYEIVRGGRAEDAKDTNVPGKWIPCSERLPENAMNVIAQFSSGTVTELRYAGNGIFEGIYEYEYSTKVIIAWMPLPEPYRENEKNE